MARLLNIKPISSLRAYGKMFSELTDEKPICLTKDGFAKYYILTAAEFERMEKELEINKEHKT